MSNCSSKDLKFLKEAIKKSAESVRLGGYPVGAIIVKDDKIISFGLSNGNNLNDATQHAEIDAIRKASKILKMRNLKEVTLYSSMEPCLMCFSASCWAYIPRIVFACSRKKLPRQYFEGNHNLPKINSKCNRQIEVIHIKQLEEEALEIINNWKNK